MTAIQHRARTQLTALLWEKAINTYGIGLETLPGSRPLAVQAAVLRGNAGEEPVTLADEGGRGTDVPMGCPPQDADGNSCV